MPTEYLLYTQIGSIIGYVVLLFVLYRLLVEQKDSIITLLKERITGLEAQINDLRNQTPDALVTSLSSRVQVTLDEIERLHTDGEKYKGELAEKEASLEATKQRLELITNTLKDTDLVCPHCEAPLTRRHYKIVHGYIGDREAEAEIEITEYECGLVTHDGSESSSCSASRQG